MLKQDFDVAGAIAGMREHADEQIAEVLLNQRVMAGIGNVYKSETCFICGVNPFRQVRSLDPDQLEQLVFTARKFLALNVAEDADGEISTYAGLRRTTHNSDQSARLWVYGRRGEAVSPMWNTDRDAQARRGRANYFLVPDLPADPVKIASSEDQ